MPELRSGRSRILRPRYVGGYLSFRRCRIGRYSTITEANIKNCLLAEWDAGSRQAAQNDFQSDGNTRGIVVR